jgi:hypothetical protein
LDLVLRGRSRHGTPLGYNRELHRFAEITQLMAERFA